MPAWVLSVSNFENPHMVTISPVLREVGSLRPCQWFSAGTSHENSYPACEQLRVSILKHFAGSAQIGTGAARGNGLRVGLALTAGQRLDRHQVRMLDALLAADFLRISHVFNLKHSGRSTNGWLDMAIGWAYDFIDRRLLSGSAGVDDFAESCERLSQCRWIDCTVSSSGDGLEIAHDAPAGNELDVVIAIHPSVMVRELRRFARRGIVWVGPVDRPCGRCAARQQLMTTLRASLPMIDVVWLLAQDAEAAVPLEIASTRRVSLVSVRRNVTPLRTLEPYVLLAALRRLRQSTVASQECDQIGATAGGEVGVCPTTLLALGMRAAVRQVRHRRTRRAHADHWIIGIRRVHDGAANFLDPAGYRWAKSPLGHCWADPFLFERDGASWLFFEEISDIGGRASLACCPLHEDGSVGQGQVILERPYHLSYPQVFAVDGEIFMLPETAANRTIELYRAVSFPYHWEFVRVLREGPCVDTTVYRRDGKFWFFASLTEDKASIASRLLLFSAEHIDGDWVPHPANPISADARWARNAGSLLHCADSLVRPAQDGSQTYGGAIRFRRVDCWNEREYRESDAGALLPERFEQTLGVHTYNRSTNFEVIDRKVTLAVLQEIDARMER